MKAWRFFNYYLSRSCDRIYFKDLETNLILTLLSKKIIETLNSALAKSVGGVRKKLEWQEVEAEEKE